MTEPDFSNVETAGCPAGDAGRDMILRMNREHGPLRAWGFAHIPVGRSVLDVGCGAGAALRELAEQYPEADLTGCDISPLAVETATALNEEFVKAGRLRFLRCGVPDLPFDDGAFDTVFSVESLYFWPDQLAGLREIRRVLAPGGHFMTALEMVGGMMNERQLAIVKHLNMVCPTRDELAELLTAAGFHGVSVDFEPEHRWLCASASR
ncbi:MAG: class I SAM-dependent methyltransferase [Lentisphaeria bacterium]|nr:class I SAM-dependent methyltransferase [Lentisphaeria bacterium]